MQQARDLANRESGCCSFFCFTGTSDHETVRMDIEVPAEYTHVLTGIESQATAPLVDAR